MMQMLDGVVAKYSGNLFFCIFVHSKTLDGFLRPKQMSSLKEMTSVSIFKPTTGRFL